MSDFPNHSMNSLRSNSISYFVPQIVFANPRLNIDSENPTYSTSSSIHCKKYYHSIGTQKTKERFCAGAEGEFHVYALEWTADYIRTYVDGKELFYFENDGKGDKQTWPFNTPFYVILNLAWGGDWGGAQGVDESVLPITMEVDYVRVFQKP